MHVHWGSGARWYRWSPACVPGGSRTPVASHPQSRAGLMRSDQSSWARLAFTAGFIAMWSLGSVIVGRLRIRRVGRRASSQLGALPFASDYEVEPLVDLLAFRDLAYVPVKAVQRVCPTEEAPRTTTG